MSKLKSLFEGQENLSPTFLTEVEAIVNELATTTAAEKITEAEARFTTERVALVEAHEATISALKETFTEEMATKLDGFLESTITEWANTNALGIDAKIKTEAAETLLQGMVKVFAESKININTDQAHIVEGLNTQVTELSTKLNESQTALTEAQTAKAELARKAVLNSVFEGLAMTQVERGISLMEGIAMTDEAQFRARAQTFRDLIEGKKAKKEGDDGDDKDGDGKDGDDKDGKKDKNGDGTDELNESVRRQAAAALKG